MIIRLDAVTKAFVGSFFWSKTLDKNSIRVILLYGTERALS